MINIVLFQPEIPQNTGNIIRTCVAIGCKLHIIKPCGFMLTEKSLRRAKMDYELLSNIEQYENWQDFYIKTH